MILHFGLIFLAHSSVSVVIPTGGCAENGTQAN